jgi:predicted cupin superfamily sugar epimerase
MAKGERDAASWIERLGLQPHPEGGFYRETYRSTEAVQADGLPVRFDGPRRFATAVYFLLTAESFSALHRIRSDELWHFYAGDPVTLTVLDADGRGTLSTVRLGRDLAADVLPQAVVPAGAWFGAEVAAPGRFALVGCTVAPGFDFADFELGEREALAERYPRHRAVIERLTRSAEVKPVWPPRGRRRRRPAARGTTTRSRARSRAGRGSGPSRR